MVLLAELDRPPVADVRKATVYTVCAAEADVPVETVGCDAWLADVTV
jgi:hypothetical protein